MSLAKTIRFVIIALILSAADFCNAQDSTFFLSPKMFTRNQAIRLDDNNKWVFHKGNDSTWAEINLNTSGWEPLKPSGILQKLADANGNIEGWFRIKIRLDSSLESMQLYLFLQMEGGAADLYLDGHLFHSFGSTGKDGTPFESETFFNSLRQSPPIKLSSNADHIVAIHFVIRLPSGAIRLLVSPEDIGIALAITGPKFPSALRNILTASPRYSLLWITVSATLAFLFWLLAFENRGEKNLWLMALCSTAFCLAASIIYALDNVNLSFGSILVFEALRELSGYTNCVLILFILARIFTNKIPWKLITVVLFIFALGIWSILGSSNVARVIAYVVTLITSLYYVIASWKKLKGAQWAVVIGFLSALGFMVWAVINILIYDNPNYNVLTGVFLSFQISLLIYVSIRFREIIKEVRTNAQKVVEITEEKRQQALNQQAILEQQVKERTAQLSQSLQNLKDTQSQLIQSEKMAGLGELTAGIAHEIQNPLNFVNNFSDVNTELLSEMKEAIETGNYEEAKSIANDVIDNEEKIKHHGKRADSIVKSMLLHSRTSSGQKEPTDINALADEYLRLAYHGLRAKEKNFNASIKTDFDSSIGRMNVVSQDIGRVLLNLYNNAFYAVSEKKKIMPEGFEPTVSVITKKINDKIEIMVKDNGNGIPQKALDKIFLPFFTTKPAGQGTGLGLSLAYDIIKAHGGEIKVETKECEGSQFIIQLPIGL